MHVVRLTRTVGGVPETHTEPGGGVFAPSPERGLRTPVYAMGLPDAPTRTPIFTCPVSAIPEACWELLGLWWTCRTMRALPLAGGVVDQPASVRLAFPIFEAEHGLLEQTRQASGLAAGLAAVFGGRR